VSLSIYAHIVPFDQLEAVIGSKDKGAVARIAKSKLWGHPVSRRWEEIDELDEDAEITCRDALEDLVFARKPRRKHAYLYIFALETLCKLYGRRAGDRYAHETWFQNGTSASWIYEFSKAIDKAGMIDILDELYQPIKKTKAMPLPLSIKSDGDWPYAALVPREKCEPARTSLLANIGKLKPEFREAALELYMWLGEVGRTDLLALFYY
jgi:hypothetical protein